MEKFQMRKNSLKICMISVHKDTLWGCYLLWFEGTSGNWCLGYMKMIDPFLFTTIFKMATANPIPLIPTSIGSCKIESGDLWTTPIDSSRTSVLNYMYFIHTIETPSSCVYVSCSRSSCSVQIIITNKNST